jgi:transcriptional regulator with XRE-family HTH domain
MNPNIHPLKRWLFEHEETVSAFAVRIGASSGYLSDLLAGKKAPTLAFIARVSAATANEITATDFQQFLAVVNDNAVAGIPVGRP